MSLSAESADRINLRKAKWAESYNQRVALIGEGIKPFEISSPRKLTVKKSTGTYVVAPFIGGEALTPTGIYQGKKGDFIYVFKCCHGLHKTGTIEIPAAKVADSLTGFQEWINTIESKEDDSELAGIRSDAEKIELEAYQNARDEIYREDARYGSW